MSGARLITIPFSHYCEKARWALDAAGVTYIEEKHAPLAHRRAIRSVGGQTVPVLVIGEQVLRDSTDIALHADRAAPPGRRLIPEQGDERARVLELEHELDETLGKDARLLVYWHLLRDPGSRRAFVQRGFGVQAPLIQSVVAFFFRAAVFRGYSVNRETARSAEARLRETFAKISRVLEGRAYLVGGRFTLADLTFAALASPMLGPPEHPVTGRSSIAPPPALAALRAELSTTPAGRHALRVYRAHRTAA
jgi:glutathione S-transferase